MSQTQRAFKLKSYHASEHAEQCAVIDFWRLYAAANKLAECVLFSIPNGAHKSYAAAWKFKREGLRAGVCDLFLSLPRNGYHGLFIEMKAIGGVMSPAQIEFMKTVERLGYKVHVAYGADDATEEIKAYVEGRA